MVDLDAERRRRDEAARDGLLVELGIPVRPACTGTCRCWGAPLGGQS